MALYHLLACILLLLLCLTSALAVDVLVDKDVSISVSPKALFPIDDRLFGQMLERASFGEPGPEGALVPGTHQLQPGVIKKLQEMHISVLRFPGGTDTDFIDWCDLLDHVPGRDGGRPATSVGCNGNTITNRFGYHEFLTLCAQLNVQPLLVVNFQDGLLKRRSLPEAARHAAALVAYCNAGVDNSGLSEEMKAWAHARAVNGHQRPFGVRLFQIGNETWFTWEAMEKLGMTRSQALEWYLTCLEAYVDAMRTVDPTIEIIADEEPLPELLTALKTRLGNKINYVVPEHVYAPFGSYRQVSRDGKPVPAETLTAEEVWNSWVSMPMIDAQTGMSVLQASVYAQVRAAGYQAAVTEWNWNGWGGPAWHSTGVGIWPGARHCRRGYPAGAYTPG